MSSLFRNNYKVYLYKYNYKALQNKVESMLSESSVNKFLFESFVTNLYTIGIPSDDIKTEKLIEKYNEYVNEFKNKKPNISNQNKKLVENVGDSRTVEYKPINEDSAYLIKHERATISTEDNLLQEALAQNYALQKLQQEYEDGQMKDSSAKINWMSTISKRQTYDTYITNALNASKKLLDELFKPVIEELASIQSMGLRKSEYVYVIDLTDLTNFEYINKVETDRTKYSDDDFIRTTANKILEEDFSGNAVDSIGAISTTLEGLSNMTSFNLRQDVLLQHGITIEANDIIEIVDTNYNNILHNNQDYVEQHLKDETQFIGFVTKISLSQRFHETSLLSVTCEGISKMLSLNPTISSNAVAPQFKSVAGFISGEDKTQTTSDANVVNVFSTFFDGLNAYDLFVKLLSDTLAVTPVEEDKAAYTMRLVSDPEKLKVLPYQYAKPLLVLYHFAVTYSTLRKVGYNSTHIILARLDNNVNQEKLQAYLLMIRSQFDLFWSNMTTPITVLQTLANNTFLEIFEDRNGILILRPPRYNTWIEGDVIKEQNFIEWTQSIDDSSLKSRSDYQWSIPALGVQNEFCGGYYQDIPALMKYGFRVESPKSSPSVQSEIDAAVYSALDVTKSNSNTRTFELTVPLTQEYKLGRLYYFPEEGSKNGTLTSKGFVGYLINIVTTIAPGNVDVHRLTFKYMRAAECLETNTDDGLSGKAVTILNFKRLPELAMYQNTVTEDMLTDTGKKNLADKARRLVSSSRYYWASYNQANKNTFDEAVNGYSILSKSEYTDLYKTMTPTNIRVGDFKTLNDIKSSVYTPSQQLVNAIWCVDILARTGYVKDDYKLIVNKNERYQKLYTRQLRTIDNSSEVLKFLKKDKTITNIDSVNYINKDTDSLSAPYATVNTIIKEGNKNVSTGMFLITESLVPNILTEFGSDMQNVLVLYMKQVESAWNLYNGDDDFYLWYLKNKSKEKNNRKVVSNILNIIKDCIDAFNRMENNIYKYQEFINKYKNAKSYMDDLLQYYDLKQNGKIDSIIRAATEIVGNVTLINSLSDLSDTIIKFMNKTKVGIPAYLVNTNTQLPAVHTLNNTGSYIAGVCPINYTTYITDLSNAVKMALLNKNITLRNSEILNAAGSSIGTITKLIYDPKLSNDTNLYFYPVIKLNNNDVLSKAYNGMDNINNIIKDNYILTETEINSFISTNKSKKNVACIIRVTPTCIPETKIPAIQQIYRQDGLYVGYDIYNKSNVVNPRKAIFDPSVLYKWTKSEIEQLYTVNVYNFIECCAGNIFAKYLSCNSKSSKGKLLNIELHNKTIPWSQMIQNKNLCRIPCITNTQLSINKLNIPDNKYAKELIENYLLSLTLPSIYEINYCNESNIKSGYMYIKDIPSATGQLAFKFDIDINAYVDIKSGDIKDESQASKTKQISNTTSSKFLQSVVDKEYAQVGLYNYGPYMPYDTQDLYPNFVQANVSDDGGVVTIDKR